MAPIAAYLVTSSAPPARLRPGLLPVARISMTARFPYISGNPYT